MSRVLITNLAPLGDEDIELFSSIIRSFESLGSTCLFCSGPYHRSFSRHYVPFDWCIDNWRQSRVFDESDISNGYGLLNDRETWVERISVLSKQGVNNVSAQERLDILVGASWRLLESFNPDIVLAWNTFCPHGGVLAEMARVQGRNVFLLERGNFPKTWFLENGGLLGASSIACRPLESLVKPWEYEGFEVVGGNYLRRDFYSEKPKYEQSAIDDAANAILNAECEGRKVVFFPPDDLSLGFLPADGADRKLHIPGYTSSYDAAVKLAQKSGGITIFKPHPSFRNQKYESKAEIGLYVLDVDYRVLIDWCDVVASTGSGLQFFALAKGKAVIGMARDSLIGKGIIGEALFEGKIETALERVIDDRFVEKSSQNFKVFVGYLLTRFLISNDNSPKSYFKAIDAVRTILRSVGGGSQEMLSIEGQWAVRALNVSDQLMRKCRSQYDELGGDDRFEPSEHERLVAELEKADESETALIDFDHTLLLSNSTELFLDEVYPAWLVFFITRISDYCLKLTGWKREKWRDYFRVHFVSVLMPWTWLVWRLKARKLSSLLVNETLLHAINTTRARVVVLSNGFDFIIKPLLKARGLKFELLAGSFFEDRKSVCVCGKIMALERAYPELDYEKAIAVSDSETDRLLLDKVERGYLLDWGDDRFKAFRGLYFPFRYYAEAKYPNRNFIMRQLVGEDLFILLLSYGVLGPGIGVLLLLFISLMTIYELGYYENDFSRKKKEKAPRVSKEARSFYGYKMRVGAMVVSVGSWFGACLGANYLFGRIPVGFWAWPVVVGILYLVFRAFNRVDVAHRKYYFPVLHAAKLFPYALLFPFTWVGIPLLLSQWITQVSIYNIYRHGGNVPMFGRQRYRLAIFPVILLVFGGVAWGNLLACPMEGASYLFAALLWMIYRAYTEKFGALRLWRKK